MTTTRRLAAILAADVAGYSRLMAADEAGTLARFNALRSELIDPKIAQFKGRVVGTAGDSLLVEFASAVDAVQCAVEVQERLGARNAEMPEDRRMAFRMGVNLGDVIAEGATIHGDGVNVASRLERLAEPGTVVVGRGIHDQVRGKLPYAFADMGEHAVKNIAEPIRAFGVTLADRPTPMAVKAGDLPLPSKPSVAVLPFTNMSGDPEQEYFSDGITEDIITELSRNRGLFVIARNSSFMFKGPAVDIAEVGRKLGVRYVVEGSVRKAGKRIRVTAQLVEAATGNHVWAERYDRDLEDIFAVQDEVTRSIVAALPGHVAADMIRVARRKPTEDLDAYDCYLRGYELAIRNRHTDEADAIALLQRAIELDPKIARAHAWLARVVLRSWWSTGAQASYDLAGTASAQAVNLDNQDSHCLAIRGFILLFRREYDASLDHLERASDLSPNDADIAVIKAMHLLYTGHAEAVPDRIHQALRLNPLHPDWYLVPYGKSLMLMHRYDDAIKVFSRMHDPAFYVHGFVAGCLIKTGRDEDARRHRKILIEKKPTWTPEGYRMDPYARDEDIKHVSELLRLVAELPA